MANSTSTQVINGMIQLSADVISYCQNVSLPRSVIDQVTRSVTSIGANFTEAQDASSKKDFISKIYIAKKEASETRYWLAVIGKVSGENHNLESLAERTQKYLMMLQKINTSRTPNRTLQIANSSKMDNR